MKAMTENWGINSWCHGHKDLLTVTKEGQYVHPARMQEVEMH